MGLVGNLFSRLGGSAGPQGQAVNVASTATGSVYTVARLLGSSSTLALLAGGSSNLSLSGVNIVAAAAVGNSLQTVVLREYDAATQRAVEYPINVQGPIVAPAAPTLGTVTVASGQVSIPFADGANGGAPITAHQVYRGTAAGAETLLGTLSGASPFVDTGLTNGTPYYYKLSAVNSVGESALSNEVTGTPASGPPLYLGQVATATRIPSMYNAGARQSMSRSPHIARDSIAGLQIVIPNWYWGRANNTLNNALENTTSGNTATFEASVEYPAGTFTRITFGGSNSVSAASGTNTVSDVAAVSIPNGARFWVRIYGVWPVGLVYWDVMDSVNGGAFTFAASVANQVMGGTVVNTNGAGSAKMDQQYNPPGFGPAAIIAQTRVASVLLVGDSRCNGFGDTFDSSGDLGEVARSVGATLPYINLGCYGDTVGQANGSYTLRGSFAQYTSHVIVETGINDIGGGASAASVLSRQQTMYAKFSGKPIYQTTLSVRSASTDSWATLANQTVDANNAVRVSVNAAIRAVPANLAGYFEVADAVESARDSGKYKVTGSTFGYTVDGVHENVTGYLAIKTAGGIDPTVLTR